MKKEHIKSLLDSYYEGNADDNEEKILFDYFTGSDVDSELSADRDYFIQLKALKDIPVPEYNQDNIEKWFDALTDEPVPLVSRAKRLYLLVPRVACVLLLLIIAYVFFPKNEEEDKTAGLSKNSLTELEEMAKALVMASQELSSGLSELETLEEGVNNAHKILNNKN
ncbi:MAG: hypothetical protein LUF90_07100 [Rikenellaceae bacterium]|nr:hypothetical protein [Rikenellaceae bacterium]